MPGVAGRRQMPASNCGAGRAARPWPSETMPGYCRAGNRLPMQAGTGGLGAAGKAENGGGGVASAFRPAQRDAEASLHSVAAAERLARLALSALSAERLTLGGGGMRHPSGDVAKGGNGRPCIPPANRPAAFRCRRSAAPRHGEAVCGRLLASFANCSVGRGGFRQQRAAA